MYVHLQYLRHLLSATNQHGVHSPFVYEFVTKCLYKKTAFEGSKSLKVLLKCIPFFSVERLNIISQDSQIENRILKDLRLEATNEGPFDLIYADMPKADVLSVHKDEINNDSVIFIENIHKNKEATVIWNSLKTNEMITVSIDMFHCGLLCFRKEQVKEHFKIRI